MQPPAAENTSNSATVTGNRMTPSASKSRAREKRARD
jgi:hypothetical protein